MSRRGEGQKLRSGGSVWGRRRMDAGVSITALAKLTGISLAHLSYMENGRMIVSGEEYMKVHAALSTVEASAAKAPEQLASPPPGSSAAPTTT